MFLGERARFGAEEPPTRGLSGDRTPQARLLQESLMSSSVVVGGLLEPVAPGEAKPLSTLRQSVSEVVISSVGAKPWPPPGAARNAMTLLPGERNTEQIRTRGNHHAKPSASAAVLGVTAAAAAAADASLLRGEAESAITKEAAVPRVGDAANNGSSTALQCQGSQKEVPTFCVSRAAVDTHHGGASCCEESKGDIERGEGSAPLPLGDSNCRVVVHGSFSQSFEKAVCTEDEHEGRRPTVEPNLAASINSNANHCTASEREGEAVDAGEGVGTDAGEDDLERSVSRDDEPPRPRSHHVAEEISGSAEILETGACIDGETATADKITAPASPSIAEIDAVEAGARLEPSNDTGGGSGSIIGGGVLEAEIVSTEDDNVADTEGNRAEEALVVMAPFQEQSHPPAVEAGDVDGGTEVDSTQGEVLFLPSESFDGAKHGYVFRLGDKGLGFYVEGYVDRRTKAKHAHVRRPWNAGPGDEVIRRGPIGPVHKPFKIIKTRPREGKSAADESDMRPLTARLAAQRDAQVFQSTLSAREHAVDTHTLALLEELSDPASLKENNSCTGHGQTLGKDGKMVVQAKPEKRENDRAKLLWYRKVCEDHLRSQFLSKRSGDSTERRRVAHAASRHFAAELSEREDGLDSSLVQALKDQTKLEFLKAEYRNPGGYDDDGRLIPEEDGSVSNELHRTDEQKERTRTYGFKARQRFHVAHDDLVGAISKKDEDLQNALKNTDPATLQDIEEQVVSISGGVGVYRQKRRVGRENNPGRQSSSPARRKKSPEQLRGKFAQSLEAQVRDKDNALMEKVAGLGAEETKQIVDDLGKDARCLPDSWRQNPDSFRKIQKHRKQLVAEITADRRKVGCPWRPGGKHIAHEPWQAFVPRDHRPPIRSASEKKAGPLNEDTGNPKAQEDLGQWPDSRPGGGGGGGGGRPHTAPSRRRTPFIDIVGPSAKRVLAAQPPDASLHNAFFTYSNEPFPRFEPALRPAWQSGQAPRNPGACTDTDTPLRRRPAGTDHGRQQRVWSARVDPSTSGRTVSSSNTNRPHSAAPKIQGRFHALSQRPSTASGATSAVPEGMDGLGVWKPADVAPEQEQKRASQPLEECSSRSLEECSSQSLDLNVRSGPGVTVLWARLCKPSSDLAYKGSARPARPRRPGPSRHLSRRRDEPSRKVSTDRPSREAAADNLSQNVAKDNPSRQVAAKTAGDVTETVTERGGARGLAGAVCSTPVDAECKGGGGVRRLSGRGEGLAAPLVELEGRLRASSWKRIHQRHGVFRGYAERSRRSRVWDPESPVYAGGVGEGHPTSPNAASPRSCDAASPRSCNAGWNEGKERGGTFTIAFPGEMDSTRNRKRKTRNRWRGVAADADRRVEMDWREVTGRFRGFQVGTRRFREVADKIEASLEGKLFAAVTGNLTGEHLQHCFREAQGLVASAGALLGCSKDERERFTKEGGEDLQRRHYAATVTRLSILWAAICGVVEIVGMLERREELLKAFRLAGHRLAPKNKQGAPAPGGDKAAAGREEECPATPTSMAAGSPVEHYRTRQYWKRLELAENSAAIAESLKIWLGIVPWPVEVLYGSEKLVWSLAAEEETLPWAPDPESFADTEDVRVERVPRGGEC